MPFVLVVPVSKCERRVDRASGKSTRSCGQQERGTAQDRENGGDAALLEALIERLRTEGAPAGMWLVEIAQARSALAQTDSLLRRLAEALMSQIGS